jgi:hypothetical protein
MAWHWSNADMRPAERRQLIDELYVSLIGDWPARQAGDDG